mgnify:CR=1 FL=1
MRKIALTAHLIRTTYWLSSFYSQWHSTRIIVIANEVKPSRLFIHALSSTGNIGYLWLGDRCQYPTQRRFHIRFIHVGLAILPQVGRTYRISNRVITLLPTDKIGNGLIY